MVELVYLDYGNHEELNINELRPLDPAFARLPAQAICAALEVRSFVLFFDCNARFSYFVVVTIEWR